MVVPELQQLQEVCGARLDAALFSAEVAKHILVAGSNRLLVVTYASGQGVAFSWQETTWLVDPDDCTAIGIVESGGEGSLRTEVTLTRCPGNADQEYLLKHVGYSGTDLTQPNLDLLKKSERRPDPASTILEVGPLTIHASASYPLVWHDGPAPTAFSCAWTPTGEGPCPSFMVHHAERLKHSVEDAPRGRLHTFAQQTLTLRGGSAERVAILEEPRPLRWAFVASSLPEPTVEVGTSEAVANPPAPPVALRQWTWTQSPAFMDPGIMRVVAAKRGDSASVTFDLRIRDEWPERVTWTSAGLLVTPFVGQGEPVLVPTETLGKVLQELSAHPAP